MNIRKIKNKYHGGNASHRSRMIGSSSHSQSVRQKVENINLEKLLNGLDDSKSGERRHRSPHVAYPLGYFNRVVNNNR